MKKNSLLITLTFALTLFMALSFSATSSAVSTDCTKCHEEVVSDFDLTPIVRSTNCSACHAGGKHAYWYDERGYLFYSTRIYGVGYFKKVNTINSGPQILHPAHSGMNDWAAKDGCQKCHQRSNCISCHNNVKHIEHGGTKYTAPIVNVANGTSYTATQVTCSMSQCHSNLPNVKRTRQDGSQLCLNCHKNDKSGHNESNLEPFHKSSSSTLNIGGVFYTVSCKGCHTESLTTEHKLAAAKMNQAEDAECSYCHMTADATVKLTVEQIKANNQTVIDTGLKSVNRDCIKCHFNGAVLPTDPQEHVLYHIATLSDNINIAGEPHAACNTCHDNNTFTPVISDLAKQPIANRKYDCFTCHNVQYNMAPVHEADFVGEMTELIGLHDGCGTCHTPGTEPAAKVQSIREMLDNGAGSYSCTECHFGARLDEAHMGTIDNNCTQTCHSSSLTEEHLNNEITQVSNIDNPLTCGTCHKSTLVQVRDSIDQQKTGCAACHNEAHNFNILETVPADIPLYPNYEWSVPQDAVIWANEPWMQEGYEGGKLIISNRRNDVTAVSTWEFYSDKLTEFGWALNSGGYILGSNFFNAEYVKDNRKLTIFFYGGENHTAAPLVDTGYRLELLYK